MTPSSSKGRILIADDARAAAFRISDALRKFGFDVEIAMDGEECMRKAREVAPDMVILDLSSTIGEGAGVLKALHEAPATARVGVLLCVSREFKLADGERNKAGPFELMLKPFEVPELVDRVEGFFTRRRRAAAFGAPPVNDTMIEEFKPRLETGHGRFSLWGTRGSTPTAGARFLRHGGNTSCLSVTYQDEKFIFDAGTGIRDLGLSLMTQSSRKLHLFITHTHWDHIQGFPFFSPAYAPGFEIEIYGAEGFGKDLESIFRGQLDREYFPVQMSDMNSSIRFRHLDHNPLIFGDVKIWWEFAQHPGATVGYKIDLAGFKIVWLPDNEFLQGYTGAPERVAPDSPMLVPYRKMIEFVKGADVLIHEAQYTNDEYPDKVGWGHSAVSNVCLLVKCAGIRRWIVTHHDPMHDDAFLETKLNMTRQLLARIECDCQVTHGYDGLTEYV